MHIRFWDPIVVLSVALCLTQLLGLHVISPAHAKKSEAHKADAPIGYGGPHLRLLPMMAPYRSSNGIAYQPLLIEVEVATGTSGDGKGGKDEKLDTKGDMREKQACFILPLVHEKLVEWLFNANLTSDDFSGEKRDVLQKHLFDVVIDYVGKGFYTKLTLLGDDSPALDPKSETLSVQCR